MINSESFKTKYIFFFKSQCLEITIWRTLCVPKVVELKAEIFGVILFIPHQELPSGFDGSTALVENPSLVLESNKSLLFIFASAIYITEGMKRREIKIEGKERGGQIKY